MSSSALYYTTPGVAQVALSVANTNLDGATGTYVQVVASSANGRRIARVRCTTAITGASAANKITFFESNDGGATKRFLCDCAVQAAAITPSATVRSAYAEVPELVGMVLANATLGNNQLYAATWIAQATNIKVEFNDA
jgi:hypothetical protein